MGPLKDIKVIEFSGIGPGPYCGMLLADLGADVIRVSKKDAEGLVNKYDIHNRSKRSITADLKNKESVDELLKLVAQVDVVFDHSLNFQNSAILRIFRGSLHKNIDT